jgi:hypothetical protein
MMRHYKEMERLYRSPSPDDRAKVQFMARNPPEDLCKEAEEAGEQFRRDGFVQRGIAGRILDLDLEAESAVREPSDEQFMLAWLSWYKYGKTWRQLLQERSRGSWAASQRTLAVIKDYEKWKFNKLDPNDMRFKMDRIHFNFMAFGLDFGLDQLTGHELVDCFNALCACGAEQHEVENLRKLRKRILESIEKLEAKTTTLKRAKS